MATTRNPFDVFAEYEIDEDTEYCRWCDADLADDAGEGYDGLCGNCADRAEATGQWDDSGEEA